MYLDPLSILLLLFTGFTTGLFISICSGTAAGYMIPILTVFLGKSIHKSIGTSLFVDSVVSLFASLIYLKNGNVKFKPIILIVIFSSIGAYLGSLLTSKAPETGLNLYIGFLLLFIGFLLLYRGVNNNIGFIKSKYKFEFFKKYKIIIFILGGFLIGLTSGFTGFGGAAIITFGLIFILDYDLHTAIGSSLLVMFFLAGFGSIGHFLKGNFLIEAAGIAGFSAIIGALIGSSIANKIDEEKLGRVMGILFIILGIAVFLKILYL